MRPGPPSEAPPHGQGPGPAGPTTTDPEAAQSDSSRTARKVRKLKTLMRSAYRSVRSENKKMVKTAHEALTVFIKENSFNRYPRLWATPLENYLVEQVYLTADGFLGRMKKEALNFLDIREDMANLMSLFDRIAVTNNESASVLSIYFRTLLSILSPLAAALEKVTRVESTDWEAVRESIPASQCSIKQQKARAVTKPILVPSVGNLRKCRLLGVGGFGAVYKVDFCEKVVMTCKVVADERLKKERARCADKLVACVAKSHLLVKYHASFQVEGAFVSLMEYIRGVDLHKVFKTQCYLPLPVTRLVLAQLCAAIQFLNMTGFIHRDVKPSNIVMLPNCRVRLIDFDTCKVCSANILERVTGSFIRKTFTEFCDGQSAGTLHYLAPEILKRSSYGRAIDWWSIGVTAYLFGSRALPFHGKDDKVITKKIVSKKSNIAFDFVQDPNLRDLTQKFLQKRASDRLTGHQMTTITAHPFFEGVNWMKIIGSKTSLGRYRDLQNYFVINDRGRYSPESNSDVRRSWPRPVLDLDDLNDQEEHTPLYTFVSSGMQRVLKSLDDDDPVLDACEDASEPISNISSLDLLCSSNKNYFEGFRLPRQ